MKKINMILVSLIILMSNVSICQTNSFGINDFKQIQQAFYQNYVGSGEDTTEGGNFKQFKRWEQFWGPRLMPLNNFDTAYAYYKNYVEYYNRANQESQVINADWEEIGPKQNGLSGIGRIDAIAFHPSDTNTIYVGCPSGGVWVSFNGGQNWQNLNTDQQLPSLGISSIAVDSNDPDNIFLGTGDVDSEYTYSCGIYRSTDGGQSWIAAGLNDLETHFTIAKVLLHPSLNSVAFAATSIGIFKTTDRNSQNPTWTKVYPAGANSFEYVRNIGFNVNNSQILYATGIDIVSSTQNGDINTWNRFATAQNGLDFTNTPWPNALNGEEYVTNLNMAIAPQGDYLYVNCVSRDTAPPHNWQSETYYHVFKYNITNDEWEILPITNLGNGFTVGRTEMVVSPLNSENVYCGGVGIRVYNPNISGWELVSFTSHDDKHEMVFSPYEENVLYAGTDGGLWKGEMTTYKYGNPTTELNNGLGISKIYNFGTSRLDPYQVLSGYQDCGISYFKNNNWSHEITSDGFQCFMDENNINLMYNTTYAPDNGTIRRSNNDCNNPTWFKIMENSSLIRVC